MDLPQPPQDQELKNIIDKLAQFVARNGPEFEQMTKTKQKDNPKFSFLFRGEYFNYYQYKVTTEQAILKHRQSREQSQVSQPSQINQNSMVGNFQGSSGPRFSSQQYPFQHHQPYSNPNSSGFDSTQYPLNNSGIGANFHQQQQHQYQQLPPPPSNDSVAPVTQTGPSFRPSFPPGEQPFSSQFSHPPNNTENVYNPPHFGQPPPVSLTETFNAQTNSMIVPPGTEISHSGSNGFQQHIGPPLPPPAGVPGIDPGPVPVPGGPPVSMGNSSGPPGMETSTENINFQQHQLREEIKQSELNLQAQRQAIEQQTTLQVREGVYVARGELLRKEAQDVGLNIQEFEDVLTPITESCTKDSIWNGKHFIFTHAQSDNEIQWISQYLLYKATFVNGPFAHKLHIIYLMNDVLHHCLRKNADGLKDSLERVLAPMYCNAVSTASDEQKAKLDKLLNLWESKMHLEEDLLNQLHSPNASWIEYEKGLLKDFPQVVATVTQHLNSTFEGYQQQHSAFIQHATSQLQQLEQQKMHLEQQQQQQQQQQQHIQAPELPSKDISLPPGPPGNFVPMGPVPPFMQAGPPTVPPQSIVGQGIEFNQPPPGFPPSATVPPIVDFSKPPPGFGEEQQKENLIPTVPYFELPAGLMASLVKIDDSKYNPLDPSQLRLPLPTPPSERLLRAVENFYQPPSHERPRNCEGWEQLALYDYYKAKSNAVKEKERLTQEGLREKSRSPSPVVIEQQLDDDEPFPQRPYRRYRSVSPEEEEELPIPSEDTPRRRHSPSPEIRKPNYRRSVTPPPPPSLRYSRPSPPPYTRRSRSKSRSESRSKSRSKSRSPSGSRSRSTSNSPLRVPFRKSRSRSITPPSFGMQTFSSPGILNESNKGHQMLCSMGWKGSGLGAKEQGISQPIEAAEVRSTPQETFRGLGVPSAQSDPYEAFRKNKGQAFINRMKARAEEKQ